MTNPVFGLRNLVLVIGCCLAGCHQNHRTAINMPADHTPRLVDSAGRVTLYVPPFRDSADVIYYSHRSMLDIMTQVSRAYGKPFLSFDKKIDTSLLHTLGGGESTLDVTLDEWMDIHSTFIGGHFSFTSQGDTIFINRRSKADSLRHSRYLDSIEWHF